MKIIECVPNFSEGKDTQIINEIANAISAVSGVSLLHVDPNKSANRTVYTFIGKPEQVVEAAFRAIKVASILIDMRNQKGVHPRLGSCDVCPLIPLQNISMEETSYYSILLSERVANELLIPVYSYEYDAKALYRKKLEQIRYGEYELLNEKLLFPEWYPDYGTTFFNEKNGATIIGTRDFLVAFNINLSTKNVVIANEIASEIRESGKSFIDENGNHGRRPGLLKGIKAIGWYIDDFDKVQISTNITDLGRTSLFNVYETTKQLANEKGVSVTGSELIGLIPIKALLDSSIKYQGMNNIHISNEFDSLKYAAKNLGLDELTPFDIYERIIELKAGLTKEINHLI